ncbi:hypothetical protein [Comamonas composti]|uniref:hypothetical protein n=1 Tax=Comamonas composti TaxID=408558 RepID=UPI00146FC44E|nr:hypothetical protein [Comamonas composti]
MEFYSIGSGFEVLEDVCLGENDFFYYVNYFGLCMGNVRQLLSKISPKHVILDFAQAWFEKPPECQAAIYSPRKFFGVPDGGLLYTQMTMERLSFETGLEMQSMSHLLLRLCAEPEAGYEAYKNSESALSDVGIKSMSKMTHKILASIDHERVCAARSENYLTLHRLLGANNLLDLPVSANGPLCYPFLMEDDRLRQKLMEERVFLPTYWSDVLCRVGQTSVEAGLSKNLLPIPLDQRYTSEDMERIAHVINP